MIKLKYDIKHYKNNLRFVKFKKFMNVIKVDTL